MQKDRLGECLRNRWGKSRGRDRKIGWKGRQGELGGQEPGKRKRNNLDKSGLEWRVVSRVITATRLTHPERGPQGADYVHTHTNTYTVHTLYITYIHTPVTYSLCKFQKTLCCCQKHLRFVAAVFQTCGFYTRPYMHTVQTHTSTAFVQFSLCLIFSGFPLVDLLPM